LENKTEEKMEWTIRETGCVDIRGAAQGDHESTRHIELIHLLVQHPYYAINNASIKRPEG